MTPTIEEVKRVAIECGIEYESEYEIADSFVPYVQPATFTALPEELQAFAQHYIEVGEKKQREKDADICDSLSLADGGRTATTPGGACLECSHAIRNNTGE